MRHSSVRLARLACTLSLAALACPAFAQGYGAQSSAIIGDQAEWSQSYDGVTRFKVERQSTPTLSPQAVVATEQAIEQYRNIAAQGGWDRLPPQVLNLALGARGPAVVALKKRLAQSGDFEPTGAQTDVFDSYVQAAVRHFQARNGLNDTGEISNPTLVALNVPVDVRVRQLEINLVRLKSLSGNLGDRFVIVNIPAAQVETVENGVVATRHAAGVGKIDRQSPIMTAKATEVNFNPFWTVPASIIKKDLIPKMQADPNYLTDNKIRAFNKAGQEVSPSQINWRSDEATHYMFRQDQGADFNSLGFVRVNIASPYGVYMHDTPAKGIFGDDFRFVSSGCVRVQNVRDYVAWLLKEVPGWDRAHIEQAIASGQRIDVKLPRPVPVYWTYVTAWATPDGPVQFRDDIYNRDGLGLGVMAAAEAETKPAAH